MTVKTSARLAGAMFLAYIATGIADMIVSGTATAGATMAAKLASITQHAELMRIGTLLTFLTAVDAIVLGVALYALTRDCDHDLAMMALAFRIGEGIVGAFAAVKKFGLLGLATAGCDTAAASAVAVFALRSSNMLVGATLFAIGSTIFAALFLRGRLIPVWLAWLGIASSLLLVVELPLQMLDIAHGMITNLIWIPIAAFEIIVAFWLIVKGVNRQPV